MASSERNRTLMTSRRFAPLFTAQFVAAFSENLLRYSVIFLIPALVATHEGPRWILLSVVAYMAPFLLLSATGGQLADRYDKAVVARLLKLADLAFAAVAAVGMALWSLPLLMLALFLFGGSAALFGPVKYSLLPDHLRKAELPDANAWMEAGTFIAMLGGLVTAAISLSFGSTHSYVFVPLVLSAAVIALIATCLIPRTGRAEPSLPVDWNIARAIGKSLSALWVDRRLLITALMVSWSWFLGTSLLLVVDPVVVRLGGPETAEFAYFTIFAVFIALGASIAAWLSAGRIVLLQAVIGTIICSFAIIDMGVATSGPGPLFGADTVRQFFSFPGSVRVAVDVAIVAITGGFLTVPSFAAIQAWARSEERGRTMGGNNILNALFMSFACLGIPALLFVQIPVAIVLIAVGACSLVAGILMTLFMPTSAGRDFTSILFRAFYGLEVEGTENLEKAGPAPILALNHVSSLDVLLANAICDSLGIRPPVFAINAELTKKWWLKPLLRTLDVFPLDPTHPMATRTLIRMVQNGQPLVIFPEGRMTVTGSLMKVYDGTAMVADMTGSMIVPVKIEGLERSFFSRLNALQTRKQWFPKVRAKITEPRHLNIDPDLKGNARWQVASNQLYQIMSDLVFNTSFKTGTVLEEVIKTAHNFGMRAQALEDPNVGPMSYGKMLTGARVLGKKFMQKFPKERALGVLLPNACGSVVTLLGVMSTGKTPAMLNFSAGVYNIRQACRVAGVRVVLTSRAFIEAGRFEPVIEGLEGDGVTIVWLDDLKTEITLRDKIAGLLMRSRPVGPKRLGTDPGAILFTSGSEGTPKGVVLTHTNMLANAAQAAARIDFNSGDKVFNVLPIFHAFGLTLGTILPLVSGVPVFLYPSPLHYHIIPEAIYASNATIVFGTDTFLAGYGRTAHPYDFRSIRYCVVGAEPVKRSTRELFMDKFGIRILEGYGVTEAAPLLSINTPMYNKAGTVGRLMPGIEARLEPVEDVEEGGRLVVRSPSIMAGYLLADEPGVLKPPPEGWHDTGDIVTIDDEGYVTIRGRAKRFAKIGGEMVSLAAVEALVDELWPGVPRGVVAVADAKKGERLVLVTESEDANRSDLLRFARQKGVSEISVPSRIIHGTVPVLGSGKTDFTSLKTYAEAWLRDENAAKEQARAEQAAARADNDTTAD